LGLVTEELADISTLLPRWREKAAAADAVVMMPPLITAWSRLPGEAPVSSSTIEDGVPLLGV